MGIDEVSSFAHNRMSKKFPDFKKSCENQIKSIVEGKVLEEVQNLERREIEGASSKQSTETKKPATPATMGEGNEVTFAALETFIEISGNRKTANSAHASSVSTAIQSVLSGEGIEGVYADDPFEGLHQSSPGETATSTSLSTSGEAIEGVYADDPFEGLHQSRPGETATSTSESTSGEGIEGVYADDPFEGLHQSPPGETATSTSESTSGEGIGRAYDENQDPSSIDDAYGNASALMQSLNTSSEVDLEELFSSLTPYTLPGQDEESRKLTEELEEKISSQLAAKNPGDESPKDLTFDPEQQVLIGALIDPIIEDLTRYAEVKGGATKLSRREFSKLSFSLTVTKEGSVYVHTRKFLGKGGFKKVKEIIDVVSGQKMARMTPLKPPTEWVDFEEELDKEMHYYQTLHGITGVAQAHTVKVLSPSKKDPALEKPSMMMELYDSDAKTLPSEIVKMDNRQEAKNVQESVMLQLAKGLTEMHNNGLYHRDLKPDNVLLRRKEKSFVAGISDFGLSDALADRERVAVKGTALYFPPEFYSTSEEDLEDYILRNASREKQGTLIARVRKPVETFHRAGVRLMMLQDKIAERKQAGKETTVGREEARKTLLEAHDVWSMGCIFYQMVHGKKPDFMNVATVRDLEIRMSGFKSREDIGPEPGNKDSLEHLVWEMLDPDPETRPSMSTLLSKLKEIVQRDLGMEVSEDVSIETLLEMLK